MKAAGKNLGIFGLYLFAFTIPVSFVPAQLGIALAVAGWFLEGMADRSWRVRWHPFFTVYLFYAIWNVLAALSSERPWPSLAAVGDNEWPVVLMIMMYWLVTEEMVLKRIVFLFLTSSAVAMAYGIWQTFAGIELYRGMDLTPVGGLYRNVGFYGFYLTFAGFAMTVFFLALGLVLQVHKQRRTMWATGVVGVLSAMAIVGSFARSIWLGMLLIVPLVGFFRGKRTGILALTGIALLGLGALAVSPEIRTRAASMFDPHQNETRINLWKTSLAIAVSNPLLGIGEDNFVYAFDRYRVEGYYDTMVHPHNDYLDALVSSGFPGLTAFLALWAMTLAAGYRIGTGIGSAFVRGTAMGASLGLAGFLVGAFFQNYYGTFANCLGWWFLVGLIFASVRLSEADQTIPRSTSSS